MDLVVPHGARLTEFTTERALQDSAEPGRRLLDLTQARWVDPYGLVALAGLVEDATTRGLSVDFRAPEQPEVRRWLARMHLGAAVPGLPPVSEHATGDQLLELHQFSGAGAAEMLAGRVFEIFHGNDPTEARTLFGCLSEVAANVCEHSGRPSGWAALQQYRHRGHTVVALAVADSGVGLRGSLSRRFEVPDDATAVRLAARAGVSARGPGRGLGLAGVVAQARLRGGAVRLWSGKASGTSGAAEGRMVVRPTTHGYPGTIAHARLRRR